MVLSMELYMPDCCALGSIIVELEFMATRQTHFKGTEPLYPGVSEERLS